MSETKTETDPIVQQVLDNMKPKPKPQVRVARNRKQRRAIAAIIRREKKRYP